MALGTLTTFDTMATAYNTTVAQFGEDRAWDAIQEALTAHNALLQEAMSQLVEPTTDRLRRYGGPDSMAMEELDEFGTPDAQKISAGVTVGFPMRFYGIGLQWTRLYFQNHMASELAAQISAVQDADVKAVHREIKKALFTPTSNTSYVDRRVDHVTLPVRALLNADSLAIPIAPDGTTFVGSSHTHYLYTDGTNVVAADLTSLINHVLEHFLGGEIMVAINLAQEATVRGFTGFTAYLDARLVPASTTAYAKGALDMTNMTNRAIGVFGPAEVWVKPWVPSGYLVAMHLGGNKALAMRTRNGGGGQLELLFDNEIYPLRARALGREFGVGVSDRAAAACMYVDTGNGNAYVAPTIT